MCLFSLYKGAGGIHIDAMRAMIKKVRMDGGGVIHNHARVGMLVVGLCLVQQLFMAGGVACVLREDATLGRCAGMWYAHPVHILLAVEILFNDGWDGFDLRAQLLLNLVQVEPVIVGDEVDGETQVAESPRATHTMQIGLGVFGKVKVDNHIDSLHVNATREQVCVVTGKKLQTRGCCSGCTHTHHDTTQSSNRLMHIPEDTRLRQWPLRKS